MVALSFYRDILFLLKRCFLRYLSINKTVYFSGIKPMINMKKTKKTTTENQSLNAYTVLAGSEKSIPQAVSAGTVNANEIMGVTVRVRRKKSIEKSLKDIRHISHEMYEKEYGSTAEDMDMVEAFAQLYHLTVVERSAARRSVVLTGNVNDFETAFQVHLSNYINADGTTFRGRVGNIHIPQKLEGIIEGVFGLDNRPHATPKFQVLQHESKFTAHAAAAGSFTPDKLAKIYGFPQGVNGQGQCIGIIELGGGFRNADINNYFKVGRWFNIGHGDEDNMQQVVSCEIIESITEIKF